MAVQPCETTGLGYCVLFSFFEVMGGVARARNQGLAGSLVLHLRNTEE